MANDKVLRDRSRNILHVKHDHKYHCRNSPLETIVCYRYPRGDQGQYIQVHNKYFLLSAKGDISINLDKGLAQTNLRFQRSTSQESDGKSERKDSYSEGDRITLLATQILGTE